MDKLKDVNEIKHRLIDWLKTESAKGFNSAEEVQIMGEVVDMVKDLAVAEEKCIKGAYYEGMMEPESERMGYDRWRYASGRFAPKGRGTRGYTPERMMPTDRAGMPPYYRDERMGYHDAKMDEMMDSVQAMWEKAPMEDRDHLKEQLKDLIYRMEQE